MIEIIDCKPLSEAKVRATGNKWAMENFIATHY